MLGKVMKYDSKRIGRVLIPVYLVTILMAGVNYVFQRLTGINAIFGMMSALVLLVFILLLIGVMIGTFVISIKDFYTNLLKDEGYLTNTLPVSKETLVMSKILVGLGYCICSTIVVFVAISLGFFDANLFTIIIDGLTSGFIAKITGIPQPWDVVFMASMMLLSYLSQLLFVFFAISLGGRHHGNRIVYSFVYGIVLYSIQQLISIIWLGMLAIINPNIMTDLATNGQVASDLFGIVYGSSTILSLLIIVAYWFGTVWMLKHKLNLE